VDDFKILVLDRQNLMSAGELGIVILACSLHSRSF